MKIVQKCKEGRLASAHPFTQERAKLKSMDAGRKRHFLCEGEAVTT